MTTSTEKYNEILVDELRDQIKEWRKQQQQLEDMIEAAFIRIDDVAGVDFWRKVFEK